MGEGMKASTGSRLAQASQVRPRRAGSLPCAIKLILGAEKTDVVETLLDSQYNVLENLKTDKQHHEVWKMHLALKKILIIAEIFYCSSKLTFAGQLHKRASVHPTTDELGHVDCDTEVIGSAHHHSEEPQISSTSDIVEYPRRAVNWQEFRTVRYVPQRNTFVAIDFPEDYGKISDQKENIKDRTWAKGKVKALKGWIENTEQYQLEGSSETCGICQEEYDSDHLPSRFAFSLIAITFSMRIVLKIGSKDIAH
ncbi:hypothetical protein KEM48_011634 [Puccinia striiformis f. sp. tritici PST-130]|nr:hypothetical protein KEM48_011634 [Puccinia striiformis f. sp. tritici PST-130]